MSEFGDMMLDAATELRLMFGTAAVYALNGGTGINATVRLQPVMSSEFENETGRSQHVMRRCTFERSEVDCPSKGATVTVDGVIWTVGDTESTSETFVTVVLHRNEAIEVSRQGYRKK